MTETPKPEPTSEAEAEPQFNPLRTWDELCNELGEPNLGPLGIPETELER